MWLLFEFYLSTDIDNIILYTNAAGSIKLIIQRDDNGHIQSIDVE